MSFFLTVFQNISHDIRVSFWQRSAGRVICNSVLKEDHMPSDHCAMFDLIDSNLSTT